MNNNFSEVVSSLLSGVDNFLSTKTVVGQATQIGDTIILPLVDVTFGVGAGAAAGHDARDGPVVLRKYPGARDPLRNEGHQEVDAQRPQGDALVRGTGHLPLL